MAGVIGPDTPAYVCMKPLRYTPKATGASLLVAKLLGLDFKANTNAGGIW